jgi:hypothetical protein
MENTMTRSPVQAPLHLWIVGGLATLWSLVGATDYVMSRMHNVAWMKAMMPEADPGPVYAYIDAMPIWASIGWGLGVWGGLLGALLLLIRSRHAVSAFLASLVGMALSFGDQFFIHRPPPPMDDPIMPLVVIVIGLGLFVYARAMKIKGVLR